MKQAFLIICTFYCISVIHAQYDPWADSVISFQPGTMTTFGQDSAYFPMNILGATDTNATWTTPCSDPAGVVSLGLGGEIILHFSDNTIYNGPGPDFTIFENAFQIQFGPRAGEIFAEPAVVSVSPDGINFYEFPWDSISLDGCAGITPTNGAADPLNPDESGGDNFDLTSLGLDSISYIKLTDVSAIIRSDTSHPFFDYTANGFDLDAVAGLYANLVTSVKPVEGKGRKSAENIAISPNPVNRSSSGIIKLNWVTETPSDNNILVYNILGELVTEIHLPSLTAGPQKVSLPVTNFSSGIYIAVISWENNRKSAKFSVVR